MQQVQARLLPFANEKKTLVVPFGLTIQQQIDYLVPREQRPRNLDIVVTINGEVIDPFFWRAVKPKPAAIIGICYVGGKSGGKNPLATIISIAALVVAPYIAGWATGAFITATGSTSLLAAQAVYGAVRIGVGIVGFLASSMLSSVPNQSARASAKESPTMFIDGASNQLDPWGVVPANLGKNRMFPPQCAFPYPETVGNKQYSRQLFTWGYGDVVISNRRIGETDIANYNNVQTEDRLNSDLNSGTSLYTNDTFPDGFSVTLAEADAATIRTTQPNTDEAYIDITWLQGLVKYNSAGQRTNRTVEFEIKFAPHGTTTWSTGITGKYFAASSITVPNPTVGTIGKHILCINNDTGVLKLLNYTDRDRAPPVVPDNYVRLCSFDSAVVTADPYSAHLINFIDEHTAAVPDTIADNGSFTPSVSGMNINVTDGSFSALTFIVTNSSAEAVRVSRPMYFPSRGQWDISIHRVTDDTTDEKIRDVATLTMIRSITYQNPVNQADISGTAMRILGSDQLNGLVDRFNADVETIVLDYKEASDSWVSGVSSNPASLYRYVLQSPAFAKALGDSRINLTKLAEWHAYCVLKGLTFNRVIDYETSVEEVLNDIAAAGMATPHYVDGIYGVIIDNERPEIKGMVNPRNSWNYSGSITYPELPHALRVEFRNKNQGYRTDEVIVYADGYTSANATLFQRLSFPSCTDSDLAWFYGRMYLASIILQPETHKFTQDFENLTYNRGDRIVFVNDVILVGAGYGRIKTVIEKPGDPTKLIGFTLDSIVSIPNSNVFGARIRQADGSGFNYYLLDTVVGETDTFTFADEVAYNAIADAEKWITSLCNFVQDGDELDLLVTDIKGNPDQSAVITAVNYAPERFDAVTGTIPAFNSHVTVPLDQQTPAAPILGGTVQSDENVMLKNSDGSFVGRMIIPLINNNESSVTPIVRVRPVGATVWNAANVLWRDPTMLILTGFDDGMYYDIEIRYQRPGGRQLVSPPLAINNQQYVGASTDPDDVADFNVSGLGDVGLFTWTPNDDIDIKYYEIRFTSLTGGATWENSQVLQTNITTNHVSLPMQSGTYLIKAFDILGNESVTATPIINFDDGAFINVVEFLQEQTAFTGTKVNCHAWGGSLYISDPSLSAEYYFASGVSLSDIYTSFLSASVVASGVRINRIRGIGSIRGETSIRGSGGPLVRSISSIRGDLSLRGVVVGSWSVTLQMRLSQDGGGTWAAWEDFKVGNNVFSDIEFRLLLTSSDATISPKVSTLEVTVDMPDRHESDDNVSVPAGGVTITYPYPFKNNPAVNITLQNGAVDDRIEYTSKTSAGFTFKVYNATLAGYVSRIFDYESSGYGRGT